MVLEAEDYSGSGNWLDANNSHDAVPGAGALAPRFLDYKTLKTQYVFMGAHADCNITIADHADMDITGDIDIQWQGQMDNWAATGDYPPYYKRDGGGGSRSIVFRLNTNGKPELFWFEADSTLRQHVHDTAWSHAANAMGWVRATLDVDNGAGQYDVKFWESTDGASWDQVGSTITGSTGTTSVKAVAYQAEINSGYDPAGWKFYQLRVYSGIGGTLKIHADATNETSLATPYTGWTCEQTGVAITINHRNDGEGCYVVNQNQFYYFAGDEHVVPDHANLNFGSTDDLTLIVIAASAQPDQIFHAWIAGKGTAVGSSGGYDIHNHTAKYPEYYAEDISGNPTTDKFTGTISDMVMYSMVGVHDNSGDDDVEFYQDGSTNGATAAADVNGMVNVEDFTIGSSGNGSNDFNGTVAAVVLFREALSQADVTQVLVELEPGFGEGGTNFDDCVSVGRLMVT
jgi:hypothetical protein